MAGQAKNFDQYEDVYARSELKIAEEMLAKMGKSARTIKQYVTVCYYAPDGSELKIRILEKIVNKFGRTFKQCMRTWMRANCDCDRELEKTVLKHMWELAQTPEQKIEVFESCPEDCELKKGMLEEIREALIS